MRKILCLLFVCLLASQHSFCVLPVSGRDAEGAFIDASSTASDDVAHPFNGLSEKYGKVVSSTGFSLEDGKRKLVIIIDAHSNISVQYNLSHVLGYIQTDFSPYAVYVEGASGVLHPETFKMFPHDSTNYFTAQYLLENGFITGTEYFSVTVDMPVRLFGAESRNAYEQNLALLKDIHAVGIDETLSGLIELYNDKLRSNYDAMFAELDERYVQMVFSGKELMRFCGMLNEYFYPVISANADAYPVLSRIAYITVQRPFIEMVIKKNVQSLAVKNPHDTVLASKAAHILNGFEQDDDLYELVRETRVLFSEHKTSLNNASMTLLDDFYQKYRYVKELSFEQFYLEILKSYKKLYEDMDDEDDENIFMLRDAMLGITKGTQIQLTPREFEYFNLADMAVEQLIAPVIQYPASIELLQGAALQKIEKVRTIITQFYESVETRNTAIVQNIITDLPPGETGVLIIGGYHKNISQLFDQHDFGVCMIMPGVDWDQNTRREISYTDQLSGKFTSLEKLIYYSWSTIVARLVSQPLNQLSSRQEAVSPIVARQLALMIGTAVTIQQSAREEMSREDIIQQIRSIYNSNETSFTALTDAYLSLAGSESIPVWPRMTDFYPVAHGQGYVVAFAVGVQTLLVQFLPENVVPTVSEQQALDAATRYSTITSLEFQEDGYEVTVRFGDKNFTGFEKNDAAASADDENILAGISQKLRIDAAPSVDREQGDSAVQTWRIQSLENMQSHPLIKEGLFLEFVETQLRAEYGDDAQVERQKYLESYRYFDQLLGMLNERFQQAAERQEVLGSVTIDQIPGDPRNRSLTLYIVNPDDFNQLDSNAYADESDTAITLYLPDIQFEHGVASPFDSHLFFQIFKQELDTRVYGIPYPVTQMLISLLNREAYQENVGSLSDRYHHDVLEQIRRVTNQAIQENDLMPLNRLRQQFMNVLRRKEELRASIVSRYALSGTTARLLDRFIGEIQKNAQTALAVIDYEIAALGVRLKEQSGNPDPVFIHGFELIERLGQGAFGVVYRAQKDGREWAIKLPVFADFDTGSSLQSDRAFKRRNIIEHNFALHINEYLLTAQAAGQPVDANENFENGYPLIAVPYQQSVSLSTYLSQRTLSLQQRLDVMIKIVHAFSQIEQRGVIVNDIKPDNIRVLADGSIHIIDFGLARADNWQPTAFDQVTLGSTQPFLSPEKNGVNAVRRDLMTLFSRMDSLASVNENLDQLQTLFERNFLAENLSSNSVYNDFFDRRITAIKRSISAGSYDDYRHLKAELETALIAVLLSFYDSRSDIFTLGALFVAMNSANSMISTMLLPTYINSTVIKQTPYEASLTGPYFAPIINKMMDHSLVDRYRTFQEVMQDLIAMRKTETPAEQFSIFTPRPIDLRAVREAELSWDLQPVDIYFRAQHDSFTETVERSPMNIDGLFPQPEQARQYGENFQNFRAVLNAMSRRMEVLTDYKEELSALNIGFVPNDPNPNPRLLTIFFVDQRDLRAVGQDAFTDVSPQEVKIYLPFQPMFAQSTRRDIYQLLKRELDTRVYGVAYPAAVLQESLLNLKDYSSMPGEIGVMSERMENEFELRLKTDLQNAETIGTLDSVYVLREQLLNIVSGQQIDAIRVQSDASLSEVEKNALRALVDERADYARFTLARLDNALADMIGIVDVPIVIDGFELKEKIGYGQYGIVLRGEKDGVEWALKIPATKRRAKNVSFADFIEILRVHRNEHRVIKQKFDFGYRGQDTQSVAYPVVVMPVFTGITLEEKLKEPLDLDAKMELARSLIDEFVRLEQVGIVFTDFNPSNIFILDDGTAQVIDFGMARIDNEIPDRLDATNYFALYPNVSPEVIGASELKNQLKGFSSVPLEELVYDVRRKFTALFNRQNLAANRHYVRLVTDVIPAAKRKLSSKDVTETDRAEIRRELEQSILNAMVSLMDHQSDIFAVGTLLYTIFTGGVVGKADDDFYQGGRLRYITADPSLLLLDKNIDPELQQIIRTMLRHVRVERYEHFSEVRDALDSYRNRPQAIQTKFAVLEPSSRQKEQAAAVAPYWDERPFSEDMLRYNQRPVPFSIIRQELEKAYGADSEPYRKYLQRYAGFYELFDSILDELDSLEPGQLTISLDTIPGDTASRSLHIVLVDEDNLRALGLNAFTSVTADEVRVYLPYERVVNPTDQGEIIQILKREIDENVYGLSFAESVLIETITNANLLYEEGIGAEDRPPALGKISDRMADNFIREISVAAQAARDAQSPAPLYELREAFTDIILAGPALKRAVARMDTLPPTTIQLLENLIDEVQKEAEFSIIRLEYELADLAQTITDPVEIRGYAIKELLGVGGYGIVYRAVKDGQSFALKLPLAKHRADRDSRVLPQERFLTDDELSRILNVQTRDEYFTDLVYGDISIDAGQDNAMAAYPLYVLPVFEGKTLAEHLAENFFSPEELIDVMIKVVDEFRKLEKNGIIFNDVSPNNIFLMDDGTVRIFDFGVALSEQNLPDSLDEPFQGGTRPFLSPERNQVSEAFDGFLRVYYRYESLTQFLDNIDEYTAVFTQNFTAQQLNDNPLYNTYVTQLLPALKQQFADEQIETLPQARQKIAAAVIPVFAAMFDHRSDIFTLGTIFYWMGVMDQTGTVEDAEIENIASSDGISSFPYLAQRVHSDLSPIIRKMMQKRKDDRYQSFENLYADLVQFRDRQYGKPSAALSTETDLLQAMKPILYPDVSSSIDAQAMRGTVESWNKWNVGTQILTYLTSLGKRPSLILDDLHKGLGEYGIDAAQYETSFKLFNALLPTLLQTIGSVTIGQTSFVLDTPYGSDRQVIIHFVDGNKLAEFGLDAYTDIRDDAVYMYLPANMENTTSFFQILKRELDIHILNMPVSQAALFESFLNSSGILGRTLLVSDRISAQLRGLVKQAENQAAETNNSEPLQNVIAHLRDVLQQIDELRQTIETDEQLLPVFNAFFDQLAQEINFGIASGESILIEQMLAQGKEIEVRGYTFMRRLGEGGFGKVFLAERDNKLWAVKTLNVLVAGQLHNKEYIDKLERVHMNDLEMYSMAYDDVAVSDPKYTGYPFITAPYAPGKTLSQYVTARELSLPEKVDLLIKITDAFIDLEARGIVYNDFSPADIFIHDDGTVRILDFGMAKSNASKADDVWDAFFLGTMPYFSPELEGFQLLEDFTRKMRTIPDAELSIVIDSIEPKFIELVNAAVLADNEKYSALITHTLPELKRQLQAREISAFQARKQLEHTMLDVMFSLLDHQSDQFGLGFLFTEIITGQPVELDSAPYFMSRKVEFKDTDPDFEIFNSVPPVLLSILKKLLHHNKTERYKNFSDLKTALTYFRDYEMDPEIVTAKYVGKHPQHNKRMSSMAIMGWKNHVISSIDPQRIQQFSEQLTGRMDTISQQLTQSFGDDAYSAAFIHFNEILQQMSTQIQAQPDLKRIQIDAVPGAPNSPPLEIIFVSGENLHEIGVSALTQKSSRKITIYLAIENLTGGNPNIFFQNLKHELDESVYGITHIAAVLMESLFNADDAQAEIGIASDRIRYDIEQIVQRSGFNDYDAAFKYLNDLVNQESVVVSRLEGRQDLAPSERSYAQQLALSVTQAALQGVRDLNARLLLDTDQVIDKVSILKPPSNEHERMSTYAKLWEKRAVTTILKSQIDSFENRISKSKIGFDVFDADAESSKLKERYSASLSQYRELLQAVKAQFGPVAVGQEKDSIRIETIPGDPKQRPLTLYFVDKIELDRFGLNAYTDVDDTQVTVYLPRERILFEQNNLITTALLKFELDRHVYGFSFPQAIIAESIFNKSGLSDYAGLNGEISDRMNNDFEFFYAQASQNAQMRDDSKYIDIFQQYLEEIIGNEAADKETVDSDTSLSPVEKQLFNAMVEDRVGEARYYLALTDAYLATLSETVPAVEIRGFTLIEKLGEGEYGRVYRAQKDGKEWALKIPKFQNRETRHQGRRTFESDFKPVHDNEYSTLHRAYDDVYLDEQGESLGYPLIAVPYKPAQTLTAKLADGILPDETLDLMQKILDEIILLHDKGIILNDVNPGNILVFPDGSVRIIDFGMARLNSFIPAGLKYLGHKSLMPFVSPEILGMGLVIQDLSMALKGTFNIEEYYVSRLEGFIQLGFNKDDLAVNPAYKKLVAQTLPALAEKGVSGELDRDAMFKEMDSEITGVLVQMLDQQSDVFSLGAIFYLMLTGQTIGKTDEDFLIIDAFAPEGRQFSRWARFDPPLNELDTIQNPALAEVVSTMLRHRKLDRYKSMREVKAALQTALPPELPPLQARLSRSERETLRQQAAAQNDLATLLREAGVLQDDIDALMELTDDQRIQGDFQLLGIVAQLKNQQLHSVVLRGYARELVHILVNNAGVEGVTERFIGQVTRPRFARMRSMVEDKWDMRFSSDTHFMHELIDFYADSRFSAVNQDVFQLAEFENIDAALKYAVGARLYMTLMFSPGEVYDAESFLDRQTLFVRILADTARQAGLDITVFDQQTGDEVDSDLISTIEQTIFHTRLLESSL